MGNMADLTNFNKKFNELNDGFRNLLAFLVRDAAVFIQGKLKNEILNGEAGMNYPKTYPSSISEGETGFVGVVSGNLRNSIELDFSELQSKLVAVVFMDSSFGAIGDYGEKIIRWTTEKYGANFFEITFQLYGNFVGEKIAEAVTDFFRQVENGQTPKYKNPFPL
jgi:hypothetical protein